MAADNNLYRNAKSDIQEMLDCEIPDNCNLLVYLDTPSWSEEEIPQLFKIQSGQLISVKHYESHNSASNQVLRQVINDMISNFESETYDLILWSHGTGWLPENVYETLTKSFGKDDYNEIKLLIWYAIDSVHSDLQSECWSIRICNPKHNSPFFRICESLDVFL
jgi:hypothetical protein